MSLSVKKVAAQVEIKCSGDDLLGLFRYRPNDMSNVAPDHVQGCELQEGEWGVVGCILNWNFKIDGKSLVAKEVLEAVDEKNKSITYTVVGGDVMLIYKSLKGTIQITENGENNLVTYTIEYEKMNEDVPHPDSLIDLAYKLTTDIETHLLKL